MHHPKLEDLVRRDPRYAYEAYEFLFAALAHTQKMLGRVPPPEGEPSPDYHVSGKELLEGVRDLALKEFGLMARTVFRMWGINCTGDVGRLVFNLVAAELMSKTEDDRQEDFENLYDMDKALAEGYRIEVEKEGS